MHLCIIRYLGLRNRPLTSLFSYFIAYFVYYISNKIIIIIIITADNSDRRKQFTIGKTGAESRLTETSSKITRTAYNKNSASFTQVLVYLVSILTCTTVVVFRLLCLATCICMHRIPQLVLISSHIGLSCVTIEWSSNRFSTFLTSVCYQIFTLHCSKSTNSSTNMYSSVTNVHKYNCAEEEKYKHFSPFSILKLFFSEMINSTKLGTFWAVVVVVVVVVEL